MSTAELTGADLAPDGPVSVETWLGAPARSYPNRPATVLDVVYRAVRRWPSAVAMVDETGATATYAQFAARVQAAAARLRAHGLRPGDRVAVAGHNRIDVAVTVFACAASGTVFVGLNPRLAGAEWADLVARCRARLALAQADLLPRLAAAAADAGLAPDRVAVLDPPAGGPVDPPAFEPVPDGTYQAVWTSGSTGRAKASRVVHRCSVHSGMSYQKVLGLRPGERTAVLFPLYYISAMHAHVLPAMLGGATCVLVESTEPGRWLDLLAEHRIAWAYAVPSWWALAARDARLNRTALPALRWAAAGGAPLPAELVAVLRARLPGTRLLDVYGLSETHSPATILLDDEFAARPGSVGRPLPCMEVEVRDDAGRPVPAGTPGEVCLRGSLVTTGYLDDPVATARSIVDGWLHTGDIGRLDGDGYLYVLDRKKDMINRGGHKIFSAEVERVIRGLPGVADVAVVPTPDRLAGEAVAALVVPRDGATLSALTVRRWVREHLADYAAPGTVRFLAALPRTSIGKVDKPALRRWLEAGAPADAGFTRLTTPAG